MRFVTGFWEAQDPERKQLIFLEHDGVYQEFVPLKNNICF